MGSDDLNVRGRRRFIGRMGALVGGSLLLRPQARAAAPAATDCQPSALDSREMGALVAVLARLIPADAGDGGAVEARAHVYIDRALAGAYAKHLPAYREGLAAVRILAERDKAPTPHALSPSGLDAILARMEAGTVTEPLTDGSRHTIALTDGGQAFFKLLLRHTLEGTFGDPFYGGNHDFLGWQLIGYPGIQLYYSPEQQALNGECSGRNRSVAAFGRKSV